MADDTTRLRRSEVMAAPGLDDWRVLLLSLHARFRTGSFLAGLRLATAIGEAAEEMNHHPDVDLRYPFLDVRLTSHDVDGVTDRDLRLARRISELAAGQGVSADPSAVQAVELALDTADRAAIAPFWRAVLGYVDGPSDDELRPQGPGPTLWFQETDHHETPRQRFHLDVSVPPEVAPGRIEAALAAGGTLVSDAEAPAFTVLADAEGNRVCVCTSEGRD